MSSPEKNRLEYLPTLVQTEIIVQLGTKQSHECLFQAYPSMRAHFNHYETTILQQILQTLIPDDKEENILKDILMILEMKALRNLNYALNGMLSYRKRTVLLDPPHLGQLRDAHRLLSQHIVLIEDYVSKATSQFPPRAYMGLPDLDLGTGTTFKGQSLDTKLVLFTSLRRSERYRLLCAFVRDHLVCKIYCDFPTPATEEQSFRLRLFAFYLDDVKKLVFTSVHDYCRTLYGATFAHIGDSWLPDLPALCLGDPRRARSGHRRLLFPDNMYFDADEYLKDSPLSTEYEPTLVDALACCGLDLIISTLTVLSSEVDRRDRTIALLKGLIVRSRVFRPWIYEFDQSQYYMRRRIDAQNLTQIGSLSPNSWLLGPYPASNSRVHESFGAKTVKLWAKANMHLVQIYRQRAWSLLDDKRLYANPCRPWPTNQQIHNLETIHQRTVSDECDLARLEWIDPLTYFTRLIESQERKKRRSQLWQEFWAGDRPRKPFCYIRDGPARSRESDISWRYQG